MKFAVVRITMNEVNQAQRAFPQWELPVLEAVYGRGKLEFMGYQTIKEYDIGSPDSEYARLEKRYGRDEESGVSYVEASYGKGSRGVAALASAMAQATGLGTADLEKLERTVSADVPTARGLPTLETGDLPELFAATEIDE